MKFIDQWFEGVNCGWNHRLFLTIAFCSATENNWFHLHNNDFHIIEVWIALSTLHAHIFWVLIYFIYGYEWGQQFPVEP